MDETIPAPDPDLGEILVRCRVVKVFPGEGYRVKAKTLIPGLTAYFTVSFKDCSPVPVLGP